MFPFFKKSEKRSETPVMTEVGVSEETTSPNGYPVVVTEIHNAFMSAGEQLLQESLQILDECAKKDVDKGKRLRSLGFTGTPQVVTLTEIEKKQQEAERNAQLVQYYSMKYPNNKFITKDMVLEICEKYNLIFGTIDRFTGFVPEKNLLEIENFKIRKEDVGVGFSNGFFFKNCEVRQQGQYYHIYKKDEKDKFKYSFQSRDGVEFYGHDNNDILGLKGIGFVESFTFNQGGFLICAPLDDMKLKKNERINRYRTIERIPAPVVLKEVEGGYLMVTAWGDEASDELVINQKMN